MDDYKKRSSIQRIFIKSTLWNHWAKMSQFGINFLFTILLTRKLGDTLYGKYSLWISICFLVSLVSQFGFENIVNTYIPKLSHDRKKISFLVNRLISYRLSVLIIGVIVLVALKMGVNMKSFLFSSKLVFICLIGHVMFNSLASLLGRVLISQYRLKVLSVINVITSIFQLTAAYIFLSSGFGLNSVLIIIALTSFIFLMLCLSSLTDVIKSPKESFSLRPLLYFGKDSWLTNVVEFGLGKQLDIILIGYFISAESEAGYYNLAISTIIILSGLTTAGLSGVALAIFSEIEKKWGTDHLKIAWESLIKLEYILSVPLIAFLAIYANPIIKNIYTDSYLPSVPMIQLYACFFIFQRLLGGGIHITVLYAMEKAQLIFNTRFAGGILNLVLNLILIPLYGGMGAVTATGFSIMLTVFLEYFYIRKYLCRTYPFKFLIKISISIVAAFSILKMIRVESFVSIIYTGFSYGLLILIILYFFKPFNQSDQNILSKIDSVPLGFFNKFCS